LKKKFKKTCCQNCPCCGPLYIGTLASPQGIQGSLQSVHAPLLAPPAISVPAAAAPATPQASRLAPPLDREAAASSPDSLLALDPSTGAKPGDVSQGGDDLKPVAPQGLDDAP
jgi:hypothetical protein